MEFIFNRLYGVHELTHRFMNIAIEEQHLLAFSLAFIASMGTFLGGFVIVLVTRFSAPGASSTSALMGILQAFSAGVMMYITCFDLVPEAVEQLGSQETMIWFFAGILLFGILEIYVIPEDHEEHEQAARVAAPVLLTPQSSPRATRSKGRRAQSPTKSPKAASKEQKEKERMYRTSLITFLAMGLHNLPEGLGVYLSTLSNTRLGLQLAIGIMLHNIPEGMAVAIPLYGATRSYSKVLFWTLLNGLAEPVGVLIGGAILYPYISQALLSRCLAMVGGIMVCISIQYVT